MQPKYINAQECLNLLSEDEKQELITNGFLIQSGVANIPTAFIAEYSNGGPIIGILGEYDALPGLMQTTSPFKEIKEVDLILGGRIPSLEEALSSFPNLRFNIDIKVNKNHFEFLHVVGKGGFGKVNIYYDNKNRYNCLI